MKGNLSPQFQSYYGLQQVTIAKPDLDDYLKRVVNWTITHDFLQEKHRFVRLIDTFFSDTFPTSLFDLLVANATKKRYKIQLLILDPFSEFAEARGKAIKDDPIVEINRCLFQVRKSMGKAVGKTRLLNSEFKRYCDSHMYINEQVNRIEELSKEVSGIEVRFYNLLTEIPVYIIGQFLAKGIILHDQSAADNPWLLFTDDVNQKDDIYDTFRRNFEGIWQDAKRIPSDTNKLLSDRSKQTLGKIFIRHSGNSISKELHNYLTNTHELVVCNSVFGPNETNQIDIVLEELENYSTFAIIIPSDSKDNPSGDAFDKLRLIQEIGFIQGTFGSQRTLLVRPQGSSEFQELVGINEILYENNNLSDCFDAIMTTIRDEFPR